MDENTPRSDAETDTGSDAVTVAIAGAAGRMGRRLVALADQMAGIELVGAFEHAGHEAIGSDSGQLASGSPNGIPITEGPSTKEDVLIDFTTPEATRELLELCAYEDIGLVIGTTGFTEADERAIDEAARSVPILQAANFSLVVNVLNSLAARAAQMLGDAYDIEIAEAHHRWKKDAPSGTAKMLARSICEATDRDYGRDVVFARQGADAQRRPGEIAVQALRLGDVVGEHTVMFAAPGERMELKHIGTSRDSYATGALRAAQWLKGRKPGRYAMKDVLGL